jgi:hypothetical protein
MTPTDYEDLMNEYRRILDTRLRSGAISSAEYDAVVKSLERSTRAELKTKLREAEAYAIGGTRHPNVQGGLPSLGKNSK